MGEEKSFDSLRRQIIFRRKAWLFMILGLFLLIRQACVTHDDTMRLMVWNWIPDCNCSPDLDRAVDQFLEEIADQPVIQIELIRIPQSEYWDTLVNNLEGDRPPDVFWVPYNWIVPMAEQGVLVALDEVLTEMPMLVRDMPDQVLDRFTFEGNLYAIPMGSDGQLAKNGYALTRSAADRGKLDEALELVASMRERVPLKGMPDLAVSNFDIGPETVYEGKELIITAEVLNIGSMHAHEVPVHFLVDDEIVIGETVIEHIEPKESQLLEINVEAPAAGLHLISTIIDHEGLIRENSKENNKADISKAVFPLSGAGLSAPKDLGTFMIDKQASNPIYYGMGYNTNVRVGFDGTNFLVVWRMQQPPSKQFGNHQLVGARITPTGTILDPNGFVITQKLGKYDSFNIAFDGTNYLVVWEHILGDYFKGSLPNPYSTIEAARVSKAGKVLDTTPIIVENSPCASCPPNYSTNCFEKPDVAFNGTDFLVVYISGITGKTQHHDVINAKFITSGGKVKTGTSKLLTFSSNLDVWNLQRLAFDPNTKEGFLLLDAADYTTTPYSYSESGIWLKLQGAKLVASASHTTSNSEFKLNPLWLYSHHPAIVADGKGNYLGVYESNVGLSQYNRNIRGVVIESYSSKKSSYKGSLNKGIGYSPDVAFDGKNYTVVYSNVTGCKSYVGAVRVTPSGLAGTEACFKTGAEGIHDVAIAFGNTKGLVVFSRYSTTAATAGVLDIAGMFIDKS